ncbi:hypothetical protein TNCV_3071871 [Trichonephila clavipes]|nr:hypothetical protein TNCV_3071871 [Trichonephila clavipes]
MRMRVTGFLGIVQINRDSDEDIRLSESDCEESEEGADVIENIPVNPDIYDATDGIECTPYNNNVPGTFATRNVLPQSSSPTSITKQCQRQFFMV